MNVLNQIRIILIKDSSPQFLATVERMLFRSPSLNASQTALDLGANPFHGSCLWEHMVPLLMIRRSLYLNFLLCYNAYKHLSSVIVINLSAVLFFLVSVLYKSLVNGPDGPVIVFGKDRNDNVGPSQTLEDHARLDPLCRK